MGNEAWTNAERGEELRVVELRPADPPRIVGPGRRERDYLRTLAHLEGRVTEARARELDLERELEVAVRVERGAQRRLDRVEERIERAHEREKRLAVLLGSLQRENEALRARVLELESAPPARALPAHAEEARAEPARTRRAGRARAHSPRGFWARLFARRDAAGRRGT